MKKVIRTIIITGEDQWVDITLHQSLVHSNHPFNAKRGKTGGTIEEILRQVTIWDDNMETDNG